mgnify:CR=1 FL=1
MHVHVVLCRHVHISWRYCLSMWIKMTRDICSSDTMQNLSSSYQQDIILFNVLQFVQCWLDANITMLRTFFFLIKPFNNDIFSYCQQLTSQWNAIDYHKNVFVTISKTNRSPKYKYRLVPFITLVDPFVQVSVPCIWQRQKWSWRKPGYKVLVGVMLKSYVTIAFMKLLFTL